MRLGISKFSTPMMLALLALVVIGFDGNLAAETNITKTDPEQKTIGTQDLVKGAEDGQGDQGEGRSLGLLKLRHQKRKRTKSGYGAAKPKGQYGAPKAQYGPPKSEYGPPKSEYGPPKSEYGPPKSEYGPPKSEYGPPKSEYGPPQSEYGPPNANYKNPSDNSASYNPTVYSSSSNSHPTYSVASYRPPFHSRPSYTAPSYTAPSYIAPSYIAPSYTAPSYTTPAYDGPSYTTPSYNGPSYTSPSYTSPAYNQYSPQVYNRPEYLPAPVDSNAPYGSHSSYEVPAVALPEYIQPADDEQEDYSPEYNNDPYASPSVPEYPLPYNDVASSYQQTNEDSSQDFFSTSNAFPTFDEFLKQNTFNFPNFEMVDWK